MLWIHAQSSRGIVSLKVGLTSAQMPSQTTRRGTGVPVHRPAGVLRSSADPVGFWAGLIPRVAGSGHTRADAYKPLHAARMRDRAFFSCLQNIEGLPQSRGLLT